jgi:hypothetical protein
MLQGEGTDVVRDNAGATGAGHASLALTHGLKLTPLVDPKPSAGLESWG